jgi:hydrogenase-1 operon protein HyaF
MSSLDEIKIRVESPSFRQNAIPILHQIRHALSRLADTGESTTIDLRAIPFGPGDEELLVEILGDGEVEATVNALGPTRIRETEFAGVWILDYRDEADERIAFQIEVTVLPSILRSQTEDIADAADQLAKRLEGLAGGAE